MFFGDNESPEERRVKVIDSLQLKGTATSVKYKFGSRRVNDEFLAFLVKTDVWQATSGDYPSNELSTRTNLYGESEINEFINQEIMTDEVVLQHAREEIDDDGFPTPDLFDRFSDDDYKIVYIHPSHFANRIEVDSKDNTYYLSGPINKTRDPFVAFDPVCQISKEFVDVAGFKMHPYNIVTQPRAVIREGYNKEASRVGKKAIL